MKYNQEFSHYRFEPVGHPVSVHVYFYDDHFQGYLVRQEVQAVGSKVRETLEMWAVPQTSFVLGKNLKEFERLKNLEVGESLLMKGFFLLKFSLIIFRHLVLQLNTKTKEVVSLIMTSYLLSLSLSDRHRVGS